MKVKILIPIIILLFVIIVSILLYDFEKSDNNDNSSIDTKEVATVNNPVTSLSGKYQIKIIEETIHEVKHNKFAIFKVSNGIPEGTAIFTSKDIFRVRDTLYFVWDNNDRIWVYSGDVGTFFWECVSDENWQKHSYADNKNVPVPALLKNLKSGYFDN